MDLDLKSLMSMARRWWWLLLLLPILGAASAWYASERQTPMYSASTLIRVNPPAASSNELSALQLSQDLGETYRLLVVTTPVLDQVVTTLNLPYDADELGNSVTASAVANTQLVRISVSDSDPEQAALIANTVATEFATYVTTETVGLIDTTLQGLANQTDALLADVAELDSQIAELDIPANDNDPAIQGEIDALRLQRAQLQTQIANLQIQTQGISVGVANAQTQVTIAEPAKVPKVPYSPKTKQNIAIGFFIGAVVAAGVIALLEYLDNTVKSSTDVQHLANTPVLATVNIVPNLKPGSQQAFVISKPHSPAAESIRLLRANLEFASAGSNLTTLAISSAGPNEGKSTIVANLAIAAAQSGLATLIIDADLRKPTQHSIFAVSNGIGLSTLLVRPDFPIANAILHVAVPNLSLIPSGPVPPNPADLLSLAGLPRLLTQLKTEYDLILIDTPPVRAVSDPVLIGRHSDGMILLAKVDQTKRENFHLSAEALNQAGVKLIGAVLNHVKDSEGADYYYYYQSDKTKIEPANS